jgi:hypothetical protein
MNFINPLPPIKQVYETAKDSFRIARRVVKIVDPKTRQRLLQHTNVEAQTMTEAERVIETSKQEVEALFVMVLWATFERFLRDYLQNKGEALRQHVTPADLGDEMYLHFHKEVEFWRPEEILDFLKRSLLKSYPHLAGEAKSVYNYRNWLAHGKSSHKNVSSVTPASAYATLEEIVNILLDVQVFG